MDNQHFSAHVEGAGGVTKQLDRLLTMQDVEQKYGVDGNAKPLLHHVALLAHDWQACSAISSSGDHVRVNVKRKQRAADRLSNGDSERTVAATKFRNVMAFIDAKPGKYQWDVK
jgi:hypothetical protein